METKKLTCICCPMGCQIEADMEGKQVLAVRGNSCPRGKKYAESELSAPVRTITSTVRLFGSATGAAVVPVRSAAPVPKDKMFDCMRELSRVSVAAPVYIGDIVLKNAAGTGVDIIVVRDMK
jgi:CxxC motif-containing protein